MTTNNCISLLKFCYNTSFTIANNPKDLDLDFLACFGGKIQSYNQEIRYLFILLQDAAFSVQKFSKMSICQGQVVQN